MYLVDENISSVWIWIWRQKVEKRQVECIQLAKQTQSCAGTTLGWLYTWSIHQNKEHQTWTLTFTLKIVTTGLKQASSHPQNAFDRSKNFPNCNEVQRQLMAFIYLGMEKRLRTLVNSLEETLKISFISNNNTSHSHWTSNTNQHCRVRSVTQHSRLSRALSPDLGSWGRFPEKQTWHWELNHMWELTRRTADWGKRDFQPSVD